VLLSMTGFGEARHQSDALTLLVEIRAVNNRFLKVVVRAGEPYGLFEPELERVIRKTIRRGTLQVHIRAERAGDTGGAKLNTAVLRSYIQQVRQTADEMRLDQSSTANLMAGLVGLPGVAPEPGRGDFRAEEEWPVLEKVVEEAVARLQQMRQEEGRRMADELQALRGKIAFELQYIRQRVPQVTNGYRDRVLERVRGLLAEHAHTLAAEDIIKEVAIFADRSDISEEVVRLDSHLEQFRDVIENESDGPGRKMEFLVQEMGRETNTIGSKAGDVQISRHVVEIKANLERIRELIQNVE
jgi:uncharacterized protein (TIGR00255 family)